MTGSDHDRSDHDGSGICEKEGVIVAQVRHIFQCADSLEGILTGVYEAWDARVGHGNVELRTWESDNLEFFCEYHTVTTDMEKAEKVLRTLRDRLGNDITEQICYAACSHEKEKGTAIYRTLVDCLSPRGDSYGKKTLENRRNPAVAQVLDLYRSVWNEYHHYLGFLRFREIQNHILFATLSPKSDILLLFQDHFGNRFCNEYWIIYDDIRKKALLHAPKRACVLYSGAAEQMEELAMMEDQTGDFEMLFRGFCQHISIRERENRNLQRQNLPLRFREHMTEFR